MSKLYKFLPAVMLLAFFTLTAEVRADQVRLVTNGVFYQRNFFGDSFGSNWSLMGAGFVTIGGASDRNGTTPPPPCYNTEINNYSCTEGEVVDFTFNAEGFIDNGNQATRIDDVVCNGEDFLKCVGITRLTLSGGQQRMPESDIPFTLTLPMTLIGDTSIYKCTGVDESGQCGELGEVLASVSFRGQGIGTINFVTSEGVHFFFDLQYTSKPIPEPTTMLLLGTGLAGIGMKLGKRRQAKAE